MLFPFLDGGFFDALDFIVIIFDFLLIYSRWLYPDVVGSKLVAILVDILIMFLLVIPYPIARYGIFVLLFGFAFFWGFQPWTWGQEAYGPMEDKGLGQPFDAGHHE